MTPQNNKPSGYGSVACVSSLQFPLSPVVPIQRHAEKRKSNQASPLVGDDRLWARWTGDLCLRRLRQLWTAIPPLIISVLTSGGLEAGRKLKLHPSTFVGALDEERNPVNGKQRKPRHTRSPSMPLSVHLSPVGRTSLLIGNNAGCHDLIPALDYEFRKVLGD